MTTLTATDNLLLAAPEVAIEAGAARQPPKINIVAYTGGLMAVPGWGPVAIDLSGLEAGGQLPLLADHNATVSGVVGHGEAHIQGDRLIVVGVMSGKSEATTQITEMTAGGFSFQASVGVEPIEHEKIEPGQKVRVNGRMLSSARGFVLIKQGRLREVSITPLGADAGTSVSIAASRLAKKGFSMTTDTASIVDEQSIRTDERQRISEIESLCATHKGGWGTLQPKVDQLKASAIAGEITVQDLTGELLNVLRTSRPIINSNPRPRNSSEHLTGNTEGTFRGGASGAGAGVIEAALLKRMGLSELGERTLGAMAMERGEQLRATHALDICRAALMVDGVDIPQGREQMVRAALSTYSLPQALGNLANKLLLDAYDQAPATWRSFCAIRSVSDFKPHTAIRPSFTGQLEQVAADGELKHGSVAEWFTQFRADTFGKVLSLDRRDLINDDLGIFDQTARAMGSMAMRKVSDLLYEVMLTNAGNFFSVAHGNYIDGADSILNFDSLARAIEAMMIQRDDEGNDLDLRPATLLVPPELQTTANALLESEYIQQLVERMPTGNSLRRAVGLEVEPRLSNALKFNTASSKHWYLFASPSNAPMVAAFLNGRQQPTVEFFGLDQDVNKLAVSWRVYHDFGAAMVDPRAAVRSKGQA